MRLLNIILFFLLILSINCIAQNDINWKTVYSFRGSSNENTDDFVIKNDKWRIVWKANKQYEEVYGGNVIIKLIDSNGQQEMVANTIPNDSGKTIIRKSGKYYFEIISVIAKWQIEVQIEE